MRFQERRHRQAPAVIIISLIDVLMVVLIFLMVSTTFKQQPAVRLALPESKQGKTGASEGAMVVTVAKQAPHLYLDSRPVTAERLQSELTALVARNPQTALAIRADQDAPFGEIIRVLDVAKAANVKNISAMTKGEGGQ